MKQLHNRPIYQNPAFQGNLQAMETLPFERYAPGMRTSSGARVEGQSRRKNHAIYFHPVKRNNPGAKQLETAHFERRREWGLSEHKPRRTALVIALIQHKERNRNFTRKYSRVLQIQGNRN